MLFVTMTMTGSGTLCVTQCDKLPGLSMFANASLFHANGSPVVAQTLEQGVGRGGEGEGWRSISQILKK